MFQMWASSFVGFKDESSTFLNYRLLWAYEFNFDQVIFKRCFFKLKTDGFLLEMTGCEFYTRIINKPRILYLESILMCGASCTTLGWAHVAGWLEKNYKKKKLYFSFGALVSTMGGIASFAQMQSLPCVLWLLLDAQCSTTKNLHRSSVICKWSKYSCHCQPV
jgi:hypothetical protein